MDLLKKTELDASMLKELKKLHFQTRRLADQGVAGSYRSAFRGRGIEFEEVREYVPGDDVRTIDWKVTARVGRPYIKSYREERELTVIIAIDVSASTLTGTRTQTRDALIAKVGAVLALIALNNNDKVGLVTFSDQLETYHPPRKARSAVWRILHEVLRPGPCRPQTNLAALFTFLHQVLKKRAVVFVISDFFDAGFEVPLATLAKRHDITAIRIGDPADERLPLTSLVRLQDPESGTTVLIDPAHPPAARAYRKQSAEKRSATLDIFGKHAVGVMELQTNIPFLPALRRFFEEKRKTHYRR